MRCKPSLWLAIGLSGCTPERLPADLINLFDWREAAASEDPFPDRPENVQCPTSSRVIEFEEDTSFLEIDTTFCSYITLTQDTQAEIVGGDTIHFRWGHRDLDAPNPAQGHVALLINEELIEDRTVDIPAAEMDTVIQFEMPDDVPLGSPVWLHLHNHGDNQWLFYTPRVYPL